MDAYLSAGKVAGMLGVSTPTVRRAATELGVARTAGGHRRFDADDVARLVRVLGVTPSVEGLSRNEVRALAALAAHPLGLRSARAVARAAGLSPTGAARALKSLSTRNLAHSEIETVAEGTARDVTTWRLNPGPEWMRIAALVARTVHPLRTETATDTASDRVPRRFWHMFWNAEPSRLTISANADYIAGRLILGGDPAARAWGLRHLPRESLAAVARSRAADPRSRAMIANVLAATDQ